MFVLPDAMITLISAEPVICPTLMKRASIPCVKALSCGGTSLSMMYLNGGPISIEMPIPKNAPEK